MNDQRLGNYIAPEEEQKIFMGRLTKLRFQNEQLIGDSLSLFLVRLLDTLGMKVDNPEQTAARGLLWELYMTKSDLANSLLLLLEKMDANTTGSVGNVPDLFKALK